MRGRRYISNRVRALREATPATSITGVDPDDHEWRALATRKPDELPEAVHAEILKIVRHLWRSNPLAKNMVELMASFVIGEGVTVSSQHPGAQKAIDRLWNDPTKRWDVFLHKWIRNLGLYGELFWPVFVNPVSGQVRMGSLLPWDVLDVATHPEDWERATYVIRKGAAGMNPTAYKVVALDEEPESATFGRFVGQTGNDPETVKYGDGEVAVVGSILYFAVNNMDLRGLSDLASATDWLDALNMFLFARVDRAQLTQSFVWDVEFEQLDESQIEAQMKKINDNPPKPGTVLGHNSKTHWTAISPDLKANDAMVEARSIKQMIFSSVGHPEHWYSEGDNANRATAAEMNEPPMKILKMRQDYISLAVIASTFTFAVDQAIIHNPADFTVDEQTGYIETVDRDGNGTGEYMPVQRLIDVDMPEMATKDIAQTAEAAQQVSTTLSVGEGSRVDIPAIECAGIR